MKNFLTAVLIGGVALIGCGSIDAALDCNAICSRYSDCYDKSYDVSACATRCRSHADTDTDYRHNANECDACLQDRACSSATFSCGAQCSSVVP